MLSFLTVRRLPEGVTLRALDRGHVQQINDLYPYRYPGSEEIMESSITLNGGLGAFRGDSLLSWAMASFYLGLGVVQTLKEERNRGLGEYVVRETTRMMAEKLHVPVHLNVVEGNRTALRFFHRLGFHQLYTSTWIYPKTRKHYDA
ncbi:hypothetical protein AAG570_003799 [Ranatra chinensis]|uniref:N-acetyltransferase domain-containing protein n=1 Tax=Ranatra chinensis TaxID=642074 RepID=A0ABD0Y4R9_9HEMI